VKAVGRRGILVAAIAAVCVLGTAGSAGAASIGETDVDFGNQNIGTTSAPQVLAVSPGLLCIGFPIGCISDPFDSVSGIGVTGPFAQTNTCIFVAPCTISVTHLPVAAGPSNGTLSADGDTVNLRGTGVDPNATSNAVPVQPATNVVSNSPTLKAPKPKKCGKRGKGGHNSRATISKKKCGKKHGGGK
jgi:hypothetical protein